MYIKGCARKCIRACLFIDAKDNGNVMLSYMPTPEHFHKYRKKAQRFFHIQLHTQQLQTMAVWQIPNNSHDFFSFPGICFLKFFRYETIETHALIFLSHIILVSAGVMHNMARRHVQTLLCMW